MDIRIRRALLLGSVLVMAGYALLSPDRPIRSLLYCALGLACVAVIAVAAYRRRSMVWAVFGAGQCAAVIGDLHWFHYTHITHIDPFPSRADAFYLAQYPITAIALTILAHRRRTAGDRGARLDGAIFTVGLLLPYWVLLIEPTIRDGGGSTLEWLITVGYPIGDVLLLAGLVRLIVVSGGRNPAFRLLGAGMVAVLGTDVLFLVTPDFAYYSIGFLVSYLLCALAAAHPSVAGMEVAPTRPPTLTRHRLLALTVVVLLAPATLMIELALGAPLSGWPVSITAAVLFVLVVARMSVMVRRLEEQAGQLRDQAAQLAGQARRLDELARTDALTGLPNRRTLDARLRHELTAADGTPLAVALLDLDRFKAFNDTFGHQAGDELLAGAAAAWRAQLRPADMLARFGGEEFVLVLPDCPPAEAEAVLDRMRAATPAGQTFSAGLAEWDGAETATALLRRADQSLYAAKAAGRDRTTHAGRLPSMAHDRQT